MTDYLFDRLSAPFAPHQVHWRAQLVAQRGDSFSALALAYIDARDVMDRLDDVCGPAGWQNSYVETPKGRVIGTISILVDGVWISKSDGAGDTDVEGEKGGISDSLKRAAVNWGIGRYLYRLGNTWGDCTVVMRDGKPALNKSNKPMFKDWTPKGQQQLAAALNALTSKDATPRMLRGIEACANLQRLYEWRALNGEDVNASPDRRVIVDAFTAREEQLKPKKEAA